MHNYPSRNSRPSSTHSPPFIVKHLERTVNSLRQPLSIHLTLQSDFCSNTVIKLAKLKQYWPSSQNDDQVNETFQFHFIDNSLLLKIPFLSFGDTFLLIFSNCSFSVSHARVFLFLTPGFSPRFLSLVSIFFLDSHIHDPGFGCYM